MRRGHPGNAGWRNENQRHFRPRSSGPQRFRHPRSFSLLDTPRFPPPGPLLHRGPHPFNTHTDDHGSLDHHDRNSYRNQFHLHNNPRHQSHQQRSRSVYQYPPQNAKQDDNSQSNQYKQHTSAFYHDVQNELFQRNSLGDIDQRHVSNAPQIQEPYGVHRISPWINQQHDQRHLYEDRHPQKFNYRHHESERPIEGNRIPTLDYSGHRPPSSDHYGSTSSTTINNNNTSFSRSVDDTVDIVRKRLMNRNDPQRLSQDTPVTQNSEQVRENVNHYPQQDQPTKKRIQRQRQTVKSNCDKMKTNIVHQLFKMDKDKIHKLMDDPGSSSKFEYAISSLITESQNSLNRHLRSVAEKSLVSNSSDFIHNDNNTIYEDTFMKQMQCLLDPQDTVLLEDIKPLVMAELSKVLQLDDFDPRFETEEQNIYQAQDNQQSNSNYENINYNEYQEERFYDVDHRVLPNYENSNRMDVINSTAPNYDYNNQNQEIKSEENYLISETLFERRTSKKYDNNEDRQLSVDSQRQRRSIDKTIEEIYNISDDPPLFDSNVEQFSEDEDTFAELDKQYHVAVDPNFIDDVSARTTPNPMQFSDINATNIKKEIDNELQSFNISIKVEKNDQGTNNTNIKQEILQSPDFPKENSTPTNSDNIGHKIEHVNTKQNYTPKTKERESENAHIRKTSRSNSRKRSIDQRPAHRKEKRKKSESSSSDTRKTSSHQKYEDTRSRNAQHKYSKHKSPEKGSNASRQYYSIFTSKDDRSKEVKDNKRNDTTEKDYSDKYVKRKRSSKSKEREPHKKRSSSTSSQTMLSPKDSCISSVTPKVDCKTKLKPIDMFVDQPKKVSVHQAHRNTAPTPATTPKPTEENKNKQVTTPTRKTTVQTKHASTQVIKRVISKETQTFESKTVSSRYSQTEKQKYLSKGNQTPRAFFDKPEAETPKATEPLERMKEIDMEIQVLLQEKFKLYHSLESKDSCPSSVKLGMTVLNVTPIDDENENEVQVIDDINDIKTEPFAVEEAACDPDAIVNDFTSIPVEELEQIALESVDDVNFDENKLEKRNARQKALQQERMNSESPKSTSSRRSNKKRKTPNISLIEQIITDDRPLEDIISLDDLEGPSTKPKKKAPRSKPKKKLSKKSKAVKSNVKETYDLKECSVILIQTDLTKYINPACSQIDEVNVTTESCEIQESNSSSECTIKHPAAIESHDVSDTDDVVEETVNDLQFDMLDVSEDIVIGESCEIKDRDASEQCVAISEDLILDNSQSSAEDVFTADTHLAENRCKMYDYSTDEKLQRDSLTVTGHGDSILAIECIENDFIAASLDGNVYHFSNDGQLLNTMRGSNLAVTCLTIVKEKYGTTVYTGSLDSRIRYYDLDTGLEKGPECNVLSPIQTMDRAWDTVFVGTRTGFVLQFECKNNMLIPVSTVKFSEQAILALRAIKEGPRKVLLVGSRSEDVTIKDAQTGLLLRTLNGPSMTVYTLLFEDGKVYCGTSSHQIHVFDYASGTHTGCHEGGKGAVCLRVMGGLLFAGCYDGCIYVYREGETKPLAQLRGPSPMLLSLAVVGCRVIAGYKDKSLYIWKLPLGIVQEMIL